MARAPSASSSPAIAIDDRGAHVALRGALGIHTLPALDASLRARPPQGRSRSLDLSGLTALDTPGALFLCGLRNEGAALTGVRPEHQALLDLVGGLELKPLPKQPSVRRWREFVIELGKGVDDAWCDAYDILVFVGRAVNAIATALLRWRTLRLPSIARQIEQTGIRALPIIGLLAIMIAVVIGYQSVAQLRPYGGEDFTINLVAVSVLREMGVLITAIMVAGRSGSAFTAEIGVMKAREEIDALEVMGLDPFELLVVPRVVGLVLTLPLLTFFSDLMGLAGGALISHSELGFSPAQYLERVRHAVDGSDLLVGIVKAPIFAFVIAVVGCMHGLRVGGSAESVGRETTRAVVKAIFLVIVLDALFSVLFDKLGL